MLDMGFIPDVERIVGYLPVMRQTLFFSATLSEEIHKIGKKFVMNPKIIEVAKPASYSRYRQPAPYLDQDTRDKREVLRKLITSARNACKMRLFSVTASVIFPLCFRRSKRHEFNAAALHGDMTQSARLAALVGLSKKAGQRLLIASDVAARGLDIPSVSHVFNFDVPSNAEDYVHRIGRTGRAGRTGCCFYDLPPARMIKNTLMPLRRLSANPIELDEAEKSGSTSPVDVKADVTAPDNRTNKECR